MLFEEDEQMNAIEDEPEKGEMAIPLTPDFQHFFENAGDEGNTDTVIVQLDLSNAILADSPPRVMPPPRPISMTGQLIEISLKLKSIDNQQMLVFPHNFGEIVNLSNVSIPKPVAQPQKTVMKETKSFDNTAGHQSVAPADSKLVIQAGSSKATQKMMTIKEAQQLGLVSKSPIIDLSPRTLKTNNIIPNLPPQMIPAEQHNSTDVDKKSSAMGTFVKQANQINGIPKLSAYQNNVMLPGERRQNAISSELGASRASTSHKKYKVETNTPTLIKTVQSPKFTYKSSGTRARRPCRCSKTECLKKNCSCFANGEFCHSCKCKNCGNNLENESRRQEATMKYTRIPSEIRPRTAKDNGTGRDCNCKFLGCWSNCECYALNIACSINCKCTGCEIISFEAIPQTLSDVMPTASSKISVDSECAT